MTASTGPAAEADREPVTALLEMTGIRKSFGPVVALDGVDFTVGRHEIHGLLGGNGAGKTTLMNVLYGLYRPDAGTVTFDGVPIEVRDPRQAIEHGIGMVHQNFLQVETYTVTENIVLGTSLPSWPTMNLAEPAERIAELSQRFGLTVDPNATIDRLSVGLRQRVEILKALYRGARLLVLDEPTTNLTPQEVDSLFTSLRAIVQEGMSVVFITHKIRETMAACDRLTVMRDGKRVGTLLRRDTTGAALAELMVGDDAAAARVAEVVAAGMSQARATDTEVSTVGTDAPVRARLVDVSVRNDHGVEAIHQVGLDLRAGEVLGVAGVAGNGQVELAEAVAGVRPISGGDVRLDEVSMAGRPTATFLSSGIAYVAEDRHRDGVLSSASLVENFILGAHRGSRFRRGPFLDAKASLSATVKAIADYKVRTPGPQAAGAALSGGNIQRVILARAFAHDPELLILHNPTRGLDIPSTQFVYDRVREIAQKGTTVLLISEDLDELTHLADRIAVLYGGRIVGERPRGTYDAYELGRLMAGIEQEVLS